MNHYGGKQMAESFRTVRKNTIVIAQDIPEDKYGFRPTAESKSVGELLVHIALTSQFQYQIHGQEHRATLVGYDFMARGKQLAAEEKILRSKAQTIELLTSSGEKFAGWLEGLSDAFLAEQVEMPPGAPIATKSRFEMILGVKEHEMHHRGQLMVIERIVGVVPHLTRAQQARIAAAAVKS
ncbi:MAG: DinB family protein [Candidatus Acidiferrales bacterium]